MGQLKVFSNFMLKVKTNIKWIGFFFILVFTAYPIITIVIDNKGIVRYLLAIFYLFGVIYGFLFVKREKMTSFKFIDLNIVFIILGTVIAYELSNIFSLSIVVSSSIVGLAGYLISRKHSFAIYTGSFVGMSSQLLFNRIELFLVAIIAAIIFQIVKNIFNGFGGRLGTIAFVATATTSLIFNKSGLTAHQSYDVWLLFLFSITGVLISWTIHNRFNKSPVIASAVPGLIIGIIFGQIFNELEIYSYIFFTATFVGMASNFVVKNIFESLFIGVILSLIFWSFFHFFNGFGGKMGLMAFISMLIGKAIIEIGIKTKNLLIK
ncbi:MAG: hypothetical protein CVV60_01505 [Tenericutes bacterium HGW-Tenericutes-5]|jgi:hypothetical protein|nr:MAG: hypothetical protein CVV60_01505 [Tenericutes bacterium HGW-Tenericutes-5]